VKFTAPPAVANLKTSRSSLRPMRPDRFVVVPTTGGFAAVAIVLP